MVYKIYLDHPRVILSQAAFQNNYSCRSFGYVSIGFGHLETGIVALSSLQKKAQGQFEWMGSFCEQV